MNKIYSLLFILFVILSNYSNCEEEVDKGDYNYIT